MLLKVLKEDMVRWQWECTFLYTFGLNHQQRSHDHLSAQESSTGCTPDTAGRECGARGANKFRTTPFRFKSKRSSKQHPPKKVWWSTHRPGCPQSGYPEQEFVMQLLYMIPCERGAQIQHWNCPSGRVLCILARMIITLGSLKLLWKSILGKRDSFIDFTRP
jgi:hypothetical protein